MKRGKVIVDPAPESAQAATGDMQSLLQRPLPVQEGRVPVVSSGGVRIGRVAQAGDAPEGGLLVLLPGEESPVPAQALCPLTASDVGRPCAVLFVDGDVRRPLVVGCIVDGEAQTVGEAGFAPQAQAGPEVVVDGHVVRIEAQQDLELRCGESVILLQRNGRIEIRGNYVTSQATATQRIRGGSVHIN